MSVACLLRRLRLSPCAFCEAYAGEAVTVGRAVGMATSRHVGDGPRWAEERIIMISPISLTKKADIYSQKSINGIVAGRFAVLQRQRGHLGVKYA